MLLIRRVVGESMLPTLRVGQIVVARRFLGRLRPDDVVIIRHNGLEKIKRVAQVRRAKNTTSDADGLELFVLGDNPALSTDSRTFGWLARADVRAKIIWPRV